jgi:hypothetical protein
MLIDPSQTRVSGPLSAFAVGFADELARQGYRPGATGNQMRLLAHLSRWLVGEGRRVDALHATEVERFLLARRAAGYTQLLSTKAMQPILAYLRGLGVAPTPPLPTPNGPVEAALERYRLYLTVERGLGARTARGYVRWSAVCRSCDRGADAAFARRRGDLYATDGPWRGLGGRISVLAKGGLDELAGVFGGRADSLSRASRAAMRASLAAIRRSANARRAVSAAISVSFSEWLRWAGSSGIRHVESTGP